MKIQPIHEIENNEFTTTLKVVEWGTSTATAEEELEMLIDFPQTLRYSDVTFEGKFIVSNGNPLLSEDEDAVNVTLSLNNKEYIIDKDFEVELKLNANKVPSTSLDTTVLTTPQFYTQAQIVLFDTKIKARIKALLDNARSNVNDFYVTTEETL